MTQEEIIMSLKLAENFIAHIFSRAWLANEHFWTMVFTDSVKYAEEIAFFKIATVFICLGLIVYITYPLVSKIFKLIMMVIFMGLIGYSAISFFQAKLM